MFRREVRLDADTIAEVVRYARRIEEENRAKRRRDTQGFRGTPEESLRLREQGYLAESAFARFLGVEWKPEDAFKTATDVAHYEVRSSERPDAHLIVTPRDSLARDFVLVTVTPRLAARASAWLSCVFTVCGWISAVEAKAHGEWFRQYRDGGEAWWVPQDALHPWEMTGPHPVQPEALVAERRRLVFPRSAAPASAAGSITYDWRAALREQGVPEPATEPATEDEA